MMIFFNHIKILFESIGSGKTYTMSGDINDSDKAGLTIRSI